MPVGETSGAGETARSGDLRRTTVCVRGRRPSRNRVLLCGLSLFVCTILCAAGSATRAAELATSPASDRKFTYVIVHGAWAGGWAFKEVDHRLTADGHKVYRPTLTGQGERVHLATTNIDLSTHIQDIVNVILFEDLHDIVLVGHSYGGMVITGVADRVPERIKHLIYVDAFLPEDGESLNTSRGGGRGGPAGGRGGRGGPGLITTNGFAILRGYNPNRPPPSEVPQPAKTLSEPISLKNQDAARKIPTIYILAIPAGRQPEDAMFYFFCERAKTRGWTTLTVESDHNVQWSHPKELVQLLGKVP
jgi:pimeloyl-ACP methyl ester carboxylesterase